MYPSPRPHFPIIWTNLIPYLYYVCHYWNEYGNDGLSYYLQDWIRHTGGFIQTLIHMHFLFTELPDNKAMTDNGPIFGANGRY